MKPRSRVHKKCCNKKTTSSFSWCHERGV